MLTELRIDNVGVIPQATIDLGPGLTVLTGETGAGKTMVVTGLRLLCGVRADAGRVRAGATQASVEGRFTVAEGGAPHAIVEDAGGRVDEGGEVIAVRVVSAQGRSKAYVGGRSVPVGTLGDFSHEVLTIHGQNDQLRLLSTDRQREALDRLLPEEGAALAAYQECYREWRKLAQELEHRTSRRRELAQEADRLDFAIAEIEAVLPVAGEEESIVKEITALQSAEETQRHVFAAIVALDGPEAAGSAGGQEEESAASLLWQAGHALKEATDPELVELAQRLQSIIAEVGELSTELGAVFAQLPSDPGALEQLLERQQQIKNLTRKYAPDTAGVLRWLEKAKRKRESIDISPEGLERLKEQTHKAHKAMVKAGGFLSKQRQQLAVSLGEQVTAELHGLAMPKAVFAVQCVGAEPGPAGCDDIEFLLAATPATEPRPLATTASGGELSRVMLALEVILSAGTAGTTLVFDEVDAGVGGKAAVEIGRRLRRLAEHNQVIVVTHLPQVAAFAHTHVHVAKDVGEEAVSSGVRILDEEERVLELSRMLAGLDDTETGKAHARELLAKAQGENIGV